MAGKGQPVTILDVRQAEQRAEWAIPGSTHIDVYHALNMHGPHALAAVEVADDTSVVMVCGIGRTSQLAAEALAARGHHSILSDRWNESEESCPEYG